MNQILLTPKEWLGIDIYKELDINKNDFFYIDMVGNFTKETRIYTKYTELLEEGKI